MDINLEVYLFFYEYKNCILERYTEKLAKQFDRSFKSFRDRLEAKYVNGNTTNGINTTTVAESQEASSPVNCQSDKMKRFEEIREETIAELAAVVDVKLTKAVEEFISQPEMAKKLKFICDKEFHDSLSKPVNKGANEAMVEFGEQLDELTRHLEESVRDKEIQLHEIKEALVETKRRNESNRVIHLKKIRNFLNSFKM